MSIHIYIPGRRRVRDSGKPFTSAELEDLANRMAAALEEFMGWGTGDEFREEDHPRREDGRFGSGGGGSSAEPTTQKPTTIKAKSAKAGLHELLSSGHAFSKQELISILGVTEKRFSDYMAMVKNPKYAGKEGALTIERNERGEYFVKRNENQGASTLAPKPPEPPAAPPTAPPVTRAPSPRPKAPKAPESGGASTFGDKANEKRFHKAPFEQLHAHFSERYGLAIAHGNGKTEKKQQLKELVQRYNETASIRPSEDNRIAYYEKLNELREQMSDIKREMRRANPTALGSHRAHTDVDLGANTKKARDQRSAMHHTALALDDLEAQGVPVRDLMRRHAVTYAAGSPKASVHRGHALPGEFAINGAAVLDSAKHTKFQEDAERRLRIGRSVWSRSCTPGLSVSEAARSTVIHELAHAIGLRKGADGQTSPERLQQVFHQLHRDGHIRSDSTSPQAHVAARAWIVKNISEYAATNWHETDAELAATVLGKGYQKGTLPKALEDHVYQLFGKAS